MTSELFVKYCPACGAENPRLLSLCRQCNADLTMVLAEQRHATEAEIAPEVETASPATLTHTMRIESNGPDPDACVLELVSDPSVRFTIRDGQTVGRTDASDIVLGDKVPNWQYISSNHALFTKRGDQWYVRHIGTTNYIIVDGAKFTTDEDVALYDNSALVLSKTAFCVHIEQASGQ